MHRRERSNERLMIRKRVMVERRRGGGDGAGFQLAEGEARVMTASWATQLGFRRRDLGITVIDRRGGDTLRCWLM